jgi:hypothetical protein
MSGGVTVDTSDVLPLLKALNGVSAELRQNANKRLRAAAGDCARGLLPELQASAARSATPQARLVASTARVSSDRIPVVQLGGSRRVGRNKTPAGRLAWGSERGGRNFAAAPGGNYWIGPAVDAYAQGRAPDVYRAAVAGILADAGVL